jgi:hypothetical protein
VYEHPGMTKIDLKTIAPLLSLAIVTLAIASPAAAQSRWERHRDRLHRWIDCDTECDTDWRLWELRSSKFTVKVSFRGQPISAVRVTLTSEDPLPDKAGGHVMSARTTDADGVARFSAILPGKYIAHVDGGLLAQSQDVEVEAGATSRDELRLEWPSAPIATRSVRGWLTAWERLTPQNRSQRLPFSDVQVQLFDLRSGKLLGSTRTAADGYYELPVSEDGLYVVRVTEGQLPGMKGYDEAVEVASNAASEHMPGLVVDQVCGNGLSQLAEAIEAQEPCVPAGAADPMPPIRRYEQNRALAGAVVIIVQQQVVVLK